jgi:hypothetical protein
MAKGVNLYHPEDERPANLAVMKNVFMGSVVSKALCPMG